MVNSATFRCSKHSKSKLQLLAALFGKFEKKYLHLKVANLQLLGANVYFQFTKFATFSCTLSSTKIACFASFWCQPSDTSWSGNEDHVSEMHCKMFHRNPFTVSIWSGSSHVKEISTLLTRKKMIHFIFLRFFRFKYP